jgi:hypothetical protein
MIEIGINPDLSYEQERSLMAYKPLMLSDTAMALLRQYDALDYQYLKDLLNEPLSALTRTYIHEVRSDMLKHAVFRDRLQSDILREIWLLWMFPDLQITRSLKWHFVLDNEFMRWVDQNHLLLQADDLLEDFDDRVERNNFFSVLFEAYTTACAAHVAARACSEKNQL